MCICMYVYEQHSENIEEKKADSYFAFAKYITDSMQADLHGLIPVFSIFKVRFLFLRRKSLVIIRTMEKTNEMI